MFPGFGDGASRTFLLRIRIGRCGPKPLLSTARRGFEGESLAGSRPMNAPERDHVSDALPRVGAAVIVRDEANRILLGKRNKDPQRGSWILPGGKIKAFESIAEAAVRELEEETGLDIEVQQQFRVYEVINPPDEHRIIIYSLARVRGGSLRAADDLSEAKFVSFDELGALPLTPLVRRVLQDAGYLEKEPGVPFVR